ncbi:hypothetical protein, partial [Ammonifex thiophilus]
QAAGASGVLASLGGDYVALALPNTLQVSVAGCVRSMDRVDVYRAPRGGKPERLASDVLVLQGAQVATREGQQQSPGVVLVLRQDELDRVLPALSASGGQDIYLVLKPAGGKGGS